MTSRGLTTGPVPASLFYLTAPMMLGVSSSIVVQTVEIGFIGQLSTSHVAAITFTFPVVMILTSIALGISIGTSSVIARSVGSGDQSDFRRLGTHSLLLVGALMIVLSIIGWALIDPIFRALGAEESQLPLIRSYLNIYYPGTVLFTITMIGGSIMRANGSANIPGIVMAMGAGLHLVLDPILIFGWFGFPRMELAGAATAMLISRIVTSAVLGYYIVRGEFVLLDRVLENFANSSRRILEIGVPAMATQLIGPVSAAVVTRLLANHGEIVVAGFGVATRIEGLAVMLFFALSGSIGPFVGQNAGANQFDRVREGLSVSYRFCLSWGLFIAIVLFFFGSSFAGLVDDHQNVVATAAFYLALVPWSYGMWGVLMTASASFNALGKPIPSTIMSFTRMFLVYIPIALILDQQYGYRGIFAATLISNVIMGVVAYFWFKRSMLTRVSPATR